MSDKTPTIRTVASRAGVGVGTVSRVLNGGSVSHDSRQRVNQAISDLGFTPHTGARSLAHRQTSTIGLVVNSTRGSWFSELVAGVEEALAPSLRSVVLASLRLGGDYDPRVVHAWIKGRRVDGLLFVRFSRRERPILAAALAAKLPVALIAPDLLRVAPIEVQSDGLAAGELAASHLLELGHRHIAFLGGPKTSRDTRERLKGVNKAMLRAGRSLSADPVWFAPSYYAESAQEFAIELSSMKKRPTAVVCGSDALALGLSKVLLERGLSIPRDISLVGFDNSPESAICWPGLTTVAQPSRQMAADACRALLDQIDQKGLDFRRTYEVELIARNSSGPPRRGASKLRQSAKQ